MAAGNLLTLLDDIASVLDDVALLTKVAAKKTAGVLGDDLALNAQQVSGVRAEREIPVVWAVFKGSALNKLILVPAALIISAVAPWSILYLLMLGGLYLCYEGFEKIWHKLAHRDEVANEKRQLRASLIDPEADLKLFESKKIKGAIRTDFILSAEIIVIALGTVSEVSFMKQALTISLIATLMTIGVYGLVALIVKLDDFGLALLNHHRKDFFSRFKHRSGSAILAICPWLMKSLSFFGTAAMFLVGGGILTHGIPVLHHLLEDNPLPIPAAITGPLLNLIIGLMAGALLVLLANGMKKIGIGKGE